MPRPPVPRAELRDAIAEFMWGAESAYDLARACDALGMPPGTPDLDPMASKRRYVRDRLMSVPGPELVEIVSRVAEEYGESELTSLVCATVVRGVDGELKNLIFAAHGAKPRIVLRDAINNVIEIVQNADKCLVYDRTLDSGGLAWGALTAWWEETSPSAGSDPARSLYVRLRASLQSRVERVLFNAYGTRYGDRGGGAATPALIPQVYLHYDPYTRRELGGQEGEVLTRQRMDFLLLLPNGSRVVIEVDGKQHYAEGDVASPRRYAEMASEDRRLRLAGYEVYRFGAAELSPEDPDAPRLVQEFFDELLRRHGAM